MKTPEHKQVTNGITRCLAKNMLPISIDDKHGFPDMIKRLNPRYYLPHKDYFRCHAIPALCAKVCDQMEKKLKFKNLELFLTMYYIYHHIYQFITFFPVFFWNMFF